MKILFYTNIPSPYRVDFYNELGKYCDLTVLFERSTSLERNEQWKDYKFDNFKGIILSGIRIGTDTAFCPNIVSYVINEKYDHIVITVLASPTAVLFANFLKKKKIQYYYEGDGGFAGKTIGLKAILKKNIISNAYKCFSTSAPFDEYCIAYGATKKSIIRYPFTSVKEIDVLTEKLTSKEKKERKKEFNIAEECAIISVGRFVSIKGFDLLLEVSRKLPKNVGVYIVGGKPKKEYIKIQNKYKLNYVHFVDFMPKEQLMRFYQAMDFFVLFTRYDPWGLVINEAMANGLPIISTNKCIAAIEMVQNGKNGYIVKSENLEEMRNAVLLLVSDCQTREKMADNAILTASKYTIEKMAKKHKEIFENETSIVK